MTRIGTKYSFISTVFFHTFYICLSFIVMYRYTNNLFSFQFLPLSSILPYFCSLWPPSFLNFPIFCFWTAKVLSHASFKLADYRHSVIGSPCSSCDYRHIDRSRMYYYYNACLLLYRLGLASERFLDLHKWFTFMPKGMQHKIFKFEFRSYVIVCNQSLILMLYIRTQI